MDNGKPIGYWLKHLDELIEANLDHTLEPLGLQRRHWQTLNLLGARGHTSNDVATELAPFLDSPDEAVTVLNELTDTGWLQCTNDAYELTDSGQARFDTAHQAVATARASIGAGLSREDYDTTMSTLRAMCQNLEREHLR